MSETTASQIAISACPFKTVSFDNENCGIYRIREGRYLAKYPNVDKARRLLRRIELKIRTIIQVRSLNIGALAEIGPNASKVGAVLQRSPILKQHSIFVCLRTSSYEHFLPMSVIMHSVLNVIARIYFKHGTPEFAQLRYELELDLLSQEPIPLSEVHPEIAEPEPNYLCEAFNVIG